MGAHLDMYNINQILPPHLPAYVILFLSLSKNKKFKRVWESESAEKKPTKAVSEKKKKNRRGCKSFAPPKFVENVQKKINVKAEKDENLIYFSPWSIFMCTWCELSIKWRKCFGYCEFVSREGWRDLIMNDLIVWLHWLISLYSGTSMHYTVETRFLYSWTSIHYTVEHWFIIKLNLDLLYSGTSIRNSRKTTTFWFYPGSFYMSFNDAWRVEYNTFSFN